MRRSRRMELLRLLKGRTDGFLASDIIGCRTQQTIKLGIGDLWKKPVNEPVTETLNSEHGLVQTRKICWPKKTFYRLVKQLIEEEAVIVVSEPKSGKKGRPAKRYKATPGRLGLEKVRREKSARGLLLYMEYPARREGNLLKPGKWIGDIGDGKKRYVRVFPQFRKWLAQDLEKQQSTG